MMVFFMAYQNVGAKYPDFDFVDFDHRLVTVLTESVSGRQVVRYGTEAFQSGNPISSEHIPHVVRWGSRSTPVDYITVYGSTCVSPRMKDIIERLEPGVHQFFPLKVVDKAGNQISEHWLWVVCNLIDSVDRERSNMRLNHGIRWVANRVENPKLVFNRSQIGICHFWRDRHLMPGNLLCSDEACAALQEGKITAVSLDHRETV